jgi:flagellar basal-body rod protein FlgB
VGLFDVTQAALEKALEGSALRQRLLANNLANANTAGFKRTDVDFQSALASALDRGETDNQVARARFAPVTDSTTSTRADGNNVDVDAEMANLSENAVTYQALVAVAKARLHMLEIAIGRG